MVAQTEACGQVNCCPPGQSKHKLAVVYEKPAFYAIENPASIFDGRLWRIDDYEHEADRCEPLSLSGYGRRDPGKQVVVPTVDSSLVSLGILRLAAGLFPLS